MLSLRQVLFTLSFSAAITAQGLGQSTPSSADLARRIDEQIDRKLQEQSLTASERTTDAEFIRRVALDISGVVPLPERVREFLEDSRADKRARVIDELLASREHARQMTDIWRELLIPQTAEARRRDQIPFVLWLKKSFAENKPWDKLFHELLTASGMQDDNPATTFYLVHESLDMIADRVSRSLLGVQIQCAQCHDHPFTDWKQQEYWAFAGFFSKVGRLYERTPEKRERYGASEMVKKVLLVPDSVKKEEPQFLRGAKPKLDAAKPYLPVLADWMVAADNPYFAKAMVNRIWFQFFGKGLVNPVDQISKENPASHPELFDLLAKEFIASGFDARHIMRGICLSNTYQRSSRPLAANKEDRKLYSHSATRVLTPFQLGDSWNRVLTFGEKVEANLDDPILEKKTFGGRNGFADFFAAEEGALPTDYRAGIPQALRLMNSKDSFRISRVASGVGQQSKTTHEGIEKLFLLTVSRLPTRDEIDRLTRITGNASAQETYVDVLWALLNSTEFFTNH